MEQDQEFSSPLPVYPLGNDDARGPRPGSVGFIGISGLVLGILGVMTSLVFTLTSPRVLVTLPAPTMQRFAQTEPPGPPELLPPNGLGIARRNAIIANWAGHAAMTDKQRLQLDEWLAEHGRLLFQDGEEIDPTDTGQIESASSNEALIYFVVPNGRMELSDGSAVFISSAGQPPVHTRAFDLPAAPAARLSNDQIQSILRAIVRKATPAGPRLDARQISALIGLLQGPGEQLFSPTEDGSDPACELKSAVVKEGTLMIATHHQGQDFTLKIGLDGTAVDDAQNSANPTVPRLSPMVWAYIGLWAVQGLCSIVMIVFGSLMLAERRSAMALGWVNVIVQIAVCCALLAVGIKLLIDPRMSGIPAQLWAQLLLGLGLILPGITLICCAATAILLRGARLRRYFGAITSAGR